jgi:hypothetical protein
MIYLTLKQITMKIPSLKASLTLAFMMIIIAGCDPDLIDISPERENGVIDGGISRAGLMINMAGDKNGLYAIGLNSGVWKTKMEQDGKFKKWMQLSQSPRYAHCLAVDPNAADHVVVGSRKGDAIIDKNCGLWESFDGGSTFKRRSAIQIAECRNNIVNAVIITKNSTILTSTPNGIGRKEKTESDFTFDPLLGGQNFTSIASFGDWIVARTLSAIYISNTDGKTWERNNIQFNFPEQNFTQAGTAGLYSVAIIQTPQTNNAKSKWTLYRAG